MWSVPAYYFGSSSEAATLPPGVKSSSGMRVMWRESQDWLAPYWLLAPACAFAPALWWWKRRQAKRRRGRRGFDVEVKQEAAS